MKYLGIAIGAVVIFAGSWFGYQTMQGKRIAVNNNGIQQVTMNTATTGSGDCAAEYQSLLTKYQQKFDDCVVDVNKAQTCDKDAATVHNVVLVLDASGSMNAKLGDETKIAIAKRAASDYVRELPGSTNLAVIVYGHKGSNGERDKTASCAGVAVVTPLGTNNGAAAAIAINSVPAKGWTPIATALQQAGALLKGKTGATIHNRVLLVTDGEETCGGKPTAAAAALAGAPEAIVTDVVAFNLTQPETVSLEAIADAGKGSFTDAQSASDLVRAFQADANFMKGFDCMMHQSDVWLQNSLDVEFRYSDCKQRLDMEEKHQLMMDVNLHEGVSAQCVEPITTMYEQRYNEIMQAIEDGYQRGKKAAESEEAKLNNIRTDMDAGEAPAVN